MSCSYKEYNNYCYGEESNARRLLSSPSLYQIYYAHFDWATYMYI